MRKKLAAFEGTLGRVSQDARELLEQREADLRRLEAERAAERAAHRSGLERKEAALRRLRADRKAEQEADGKRERGGGGVETRRGEAVCRGYRAVPLDARHLPQTLCVRVCEFLSLFCDNRP